MSRNDQLGISRNGQLGMSMYNQLDMRSSLIPRPPRPATKAGRGGLGMRIGMSRYGQIEVHV